jgi:hypothetical protein
MRVIPHLPARLRRMLTTFGGRAAAMLDDARLSRPEELPPRLTAGPPVATSPPPAER